MAVKRKARGVRVVAVVATVGGLLAAAAVALASLTQVPVLTGVPNQITPAAAGGTLSWSRNGDRDTGPYNELVRVNGGPIVQVNGPGTQGFGGGISGTTLVYQRVYKGQSDLRFYDIAAHTYSAPPSGWNTTAWEFTPTISGTMVLFGRENDTGTTQRAMLGDLSTNQVTQLDLRTGPHASIQPGQVNGNYAVWSACINYTVQCNVYEYNISAQTLKKIPNTFASGLQQYAPSVASNGDVYFMHSGNGCDNSASLNRYSLAGGTVTTLVTFSSGIDVNSSYVDDTGGTPVIYYSRLNCAIHSGNSGDIYKVTD